MVRLETPTWSARALGADAGLAMGMEHGGDLEIARGAVPLGPAALIEGVHGASDSSVASALPADVPGVADSRLAGRGRRRSSRASRNARTPSSSQPVSTRGPETCTEAAPSSPSPKTHQSSLAPPVLQRAIGDVRAVGEQPAQRQERVERRGAVDEGSAVTCPRTLDLDQAQVFGHDLAARDIGQRMRRTIHGQAVIAQQTEGIRASTPSRTCPEPAGRRSAR